MKRNNDNGHPIETRTVTAWRQEDGSVLTEWVEFGRPVAVYEIFWSRPKNLVISSRGIERLEVKIGRRRAEPGDGGEEKRYRKFQLAYPPQPFTPLDLSGLVPIPPAPWACSVSHLAMPPEAGPKG